MPEIKRVAAAAAEYSDAPFQNRDRSFSEAGEQPGTTARQSSFTPRVLLLIQRLCKSLCGIEATGRCRFDGESPNRQPAKLSTLRGCRYFKCEAFQDLPLPDDDQGRPNLQRTVVYLVRQFSIGFNDLFAEETGIAPLDKVLEQTRETLKHIVQKEVEPEAGTYNTRFGLQFNFRASKNTPCCFSDRGQQELFEHLSAAENNDRFSQIMFGDESDTEGLVLPMMHALLQAENEILQLRGTNLHAVDVRI